MRFIEKMKGDKLNLVVSCPKNDYEYVKAAWEEGADAVKIHLNVHHHASDNNFYSLKEDIDFVKKVLENSPVPVGVVVGGSPEVVRKDFPNVLKENFDFLSLYLHDAVSEILDQDKITRMFACNYTYSLDEIKDFEKAGAEILEVSFMHPDDYGKPATLRDWLKYKQINEIATIPTLLPTQKKILPSEVKKVKEVGFNAIMIGAVVTTNDFEPFKQAVRDFRKAIDDLC